VVFVTEEKVAEQSAANEIDKGSAAPAPPPRGAFRKGALLATLLILPGMSVLLLGVEHALWARAMAFDETLATLAVFAGLPTLLVFGGIGKNLARQAKRSRSALIIRGSLLGLLAGLGSLLLAAIPTAAIPDTVASKILTLALGAILGASTGALLGLWIHYARAKRLAECARSEA
jgi:hypothetical protein